MAKKPKEPAVGAHLISSRTTYSHHGIYVGNGRVIHYSGWANGREAGPVEETTLDLFAQGRAYKIKRHSRPAPAREIVTRARSRLGESAYDVFSNNCEHFCNWCVNDDHHSSQVDRAAPPTAMTAASVAGLAARGAVAVSGSVYGLSGAGITSGLGAVGSVVGGGAVAGLAILGAVPALATASLVNATLLADTKQATPRERGSRRVGRVASYAGAIAGTAGSIAAVSGVGTVAGLSGAGITSGLAALGGLIGGGMGAGVAIATTAPVIAAAAVGYTAYKSVKAIAKASARAAAESKPSES